jgi:hypothetical protein
MGTRAAKRQEVRELIRDLRDELSELLRLAFVVDSDECQHGCNGRPSCSERCTFICHPGEP